MRQARPDGTLRSIRCPARHDAHARLPARYDNVAIGFHWLLALMIVGSFCVGLYMSDLPFSIQRVKLFNWHKWAGMTILALTLLRLLWRLRTAPPPERRARTGNSWPPRPLTARCTCCSCGPAGRLGLQLGRRLSDRGLRRAADAQPDGHRQGAGRGIKPWHAWLAYALAALVVMHVAAGLKHHFVDHDGLLNRMRPRRT